MAFHPFGDFHCKVDAIRAGCSQSVKAAIAGHQDDVARTSSPSIHGVDIDVGSTDAAQTPLGHRAASSCKSTRSGLDANPGKVLSLSHTQLCHAPVPHTHNFVSHNFHTRHDSFTYNSWKPSILHRFLCLSCLLRTASTSVCDYWKKLTCGLSGPWFCTVMARNTSYKLAYSDISNQLVIGVITPWLSTSYQPWLLLTIVTILYNMLISCINKGHNSKLLISRGSSISALMTTSVPFQSWWMGALAIVVWWFNMGLCMTISHCRHEYLHHFSHLFDKQIYIYIEREKERDYSGFKNGFGFLTRHGEF